MRGCRICERGALAFVSQENGHETLVDVRRQEKHHSSDDRDEKANDEVRDATRRRGPNDGRGVGIHEADNIRIETLTGGEVAFVRQIMSESKL